MVAHVPRGARIVLEPVVLGSWLSDGRPRIVEAAWRKYPSLESVIAPDGTLAPQTIHTVALEDYETTLSPALIGWYERQGYCWVISGSTESGRALADPRAAPLAVAYYRALGVTGTKSSIASRPTRRAVDTRASTSTGASTTTRSPIARPGPEMTVYQAAAADAAHGA